MRTTKKARKNPELFEEHGFEKQFIGVYKTGCDGAFISINIGTREVDMFVGVPNKENVEFIRKKIEELVKSGLIEYC